MSNESGGDNPPWKRKNSTYPTLVDNMAVARERVSSKRIGKTAKTTKVKSKGATSRG